MTLCSVMFVTGCNPISTHLILYGYFIWTIRVEFYYFCKLFVFVSAA